MPGFTHPTSALGWLRAGLLLYVLLMVASGAWLAKQRHADWREPLWVDVYAVNGDHSELAAARIRQLGAGSFADMEAYFAVQAAHYGIDVKPPLHFDYAGEIDGAPPSLTPGAPWWRAMAWSLRLRLWYLRHRDGDRPRPDLTLVAIYYDGERVGPRDSHAAPESGLAVARVYADADMWHDNRVVMAHELLHLLGATDKYDYRTLQPRLPQGYAQPGGKPLWPQTKAEIMGARIPLTPTRSRQARDLSETLIGPWTAAEINWRTVAP